MRYLTVTIVTLAAFCGLLAGEVAPFSVSRAASPGFEVSTGFVVVASPAAPLPPRKAGWTRELLAEGAAPYEVATHTQSIFVLDGADTVRRVRIRDLPDRRWHQSGGMDGVEFKSEKYKLVPGKVRTWIGDIAVKNSFGHFQNNRGIRREYPAGTRFDDVLKNKNGVVFEHRVRTKDAEGFWTSEVVYEDPGARPKGYGGVTVRCGSCHGEAGTGSYDAGLVPGGDGTLSDPLDWSLVGDDERPRDQQRTSVQPTFRQTLSAPQQVLFRSAAFCPT